MSSLVSDCVGRRRRNIPNNLEEEEKGRGGVEGMFGREKPWERDLERRYRELD